MMPRTNGDTAGAMAPAFGQPGTALHSMGSKPSTPHPSRPQTLPQTVLDASMQMAPSGTRGGPPPEVVAISLQLQMQQPSGSASSARTGVATNRIADSSWD